MDPHPFPQHPEKGQLPGALNTLRIIGDKAKTTTPTPIPGYRDAKLPAQQVAWFPSGLNLHLEQT